MSSETLKLPKVLIRGRSFMALIVAPEAPLEPWLAALDEQMSRSAGFFADRPIIVNLAAIDDGSQNLGEVLDALASRDLRIVGLEGVDPALLSGTGWERLPKLLQGREMRAQATADREVAVPGAAEPEPAEAVAAAAEEPKPARPASLLIDRAVRSGQSIVFEDGDIIVVGSVSSGRGIDRRGLDPCLRFAAGPGDRRDSHRRGGADFLPEADGRADRHRRHL